MADEKSKYDTLKAWADIVIERWERRIMQLNVVETQELLNSFTAQISLDAAGNPEKVVFAFTYYGIFPDMGVGRGVKLADVGKGVRQPKPWKGKIFFGQVAQLARIMAERYEQQAIIHIFENAGFELKAKL